MESKSGTWYINTTNSEPREPMLMTQEKLESFKLYPHNYGSHLQPWIPKFGEWCWYNKKYFIKVKNIKDEQIYFSSLDGMYINDWDYLCKFEPFIGELPTFLKRW